MYDFSRRVLDGRYQLLERIGYGGMATVYATTDLKVDKRVAVKVLNPDLARDKLQLARFQQEARAAVKLRHEHLVDVTDYNVTADGLAYFVMEHLDGVSLLAELQAKGPMPWMRAVEIVLQVCEALIAVHASGIIHRDVKPGNCMLLHRRGKDFVKLLDLGIAKLLTHASDLGVPLDTCGATVPGTPEYMAPELILNDPYDPYDYRVDVYSLGVMMYHLLTGMPPFYSNRSTAIAVDMVLNQPPAPMRSVAPHAEIPASIEEITIKALAKSPAERWSTIQELAERLRHMLDAELFLRQRDEVHDATLQYKRRPLLLTQARKLFYAATVIGGMALCGTMFMAGMLVDVRESIPREPVIVTGISSERKGVEPVELATGPVAVGGGAVDPPGTSGSNYGRGSTGPDVVDGAVAPPVSSPIGAVPSGTPADSSGDPDRGNLAAGPARPPDTNINKPSPPLQPPASPSKLVKDQVRRSAPGVSNGCKKFLDSYDDARSVTALLSFGGAGTKPSTITVRGSDVGSALGKCIKNALMGLTFGKGVDSYRGDVEVTIAVKR